MQTRALQISDDVERLLIVSDLHGFVEPLKELDRLFALYEGKSQVVAAGDYVVNGGRPAEVVDWVRRHAGEFAVTGNHDQEALKGAEGDFAPYTDPGAFLCFSEEQKDYLTGLPEVLELSWKASSSKLRLTPRRSTPTQVPSDFTKTEEDEYGCANAVHAEQVLPGDSPINPARDQRRAPSGNRGGRLGDRPMEFVRPVPRHDPDSRPSTRPWRQTGRCPGAA